MLNKLVKIANKLDKKGFYSEADTVDSIVKSAAEELVLYSDPAEGLKEEQDKLEMVRAKIKSYLERDSLPSHARNELMWLLRKEKEIAGEIEKLKHQGPIYEWYNEEKEVEQLKKEIKNIEARIAAGERWDEYNEMPLEEELFHLKQQLAIIIDPEERANQEAYEKYLDEDYAKRRSEILEYQVTPPNIDPEEGVLTPEGYTKYYE